MIKYLIILWLFFGSYLFPKSGIILENKTENNFCFSIGLKKESKLYEYKCLPNQSLVINFSRNENSIIYYKNIDFLIYIEPLDTTKLKTSYGPVNLSDLCLDLDYELYLDQDILEIRPVIDLAKLNMFVNKKSIFLKKIYQNN
ncbi:MAG: hypothetical protein SZ59_C0005G0046 [candidate division TM6 bacterium GW2011_GWF2_28_16]|nr:MAG: hypothetical protein SZ59_C0005G0046 [candidate division TM6 bacterium GW2011_GWF2_28_16]